MNLLLAVQKIVLGFKRQKQAKNFYYNQKSAKIIVFFLTCVSHDSSTKISPKHPLMQVRLRDLMPPLQVAVQDDHAVQSLKISHGCT